MPQSDQTTPVDTLLCNLCGVPMPNGKAVAVFTGGYVHIHDRECVAALRARANILSQRVGRLEAALREIAYARDGLGRKLHESLNFEAERRVLMAIEDRPGAGEEE